MYNKFSGILRIFVAVVNPIAAYNSAVINLTYIDGPYSGNASGKLVRTAILENHTINRGRSALDDFDNQVPVVSVPNYYNNPTSNSANPYWLYADFTMNYDPCTCNNLSKLYFEVRLISTASLSFTTNSTPAASLDALGNGASQKQSLAKTAQGIVDAGNSFYSTANDAIKND